MCYMYIFPSEHQNWQLDIEPATADRLPDHCKSPLWGHFEDMMLVLILCTILVEAMQAFG